MGDAGLIDGIEQRDPAAAWAALERGEAALVDVRTAAEWTFVGVPDLSPLGRSAILVEWRGWPGGGPNPRFAETLLAELGDEIPAEILFICRSGVRSQQAASEIARHFAAAGRGVRCINVAEGFEGDLSPHGPRSELNGWKRRGLPWRQS